MAIIPYAVDVPYDRRPFANWLLVASVVLAYVAQVAVIVEGDAESVETFVLDGWNPVGVIGHMWLHGDIFHIAGNMLFLWVFGNAVCAKVGNLKYFPVYLLLGVAAAAAHLLFDGDPAIGASGAINGIVGMFLIFFWENEIHCIWIWFPFVRHFSISSFWMIGLWLLYDILGVVMGGGQIAYYAHLGGFFAGVGIAVLLFKMNWVTIYRDEETLVERIEEWFHEKQDEKLQQAARDAVDKAKQKEQAPRRPPPVRTPDPAAETETFRFLCPCGKVIKAPTAYAGKKGYCPQCRRELIVPEVPA